MNNSDIADVFSLLSKLTDVHRGNTEQAKAMGVAAFQIDKLTFELATYPREKIAKLYGVGEGNAQIIFELLDTQKCVALEQLLAQTPAGILELMQIKGIGPKKLGLIWHELGIETPGELLYACEENRLTAYKGFGEKTQQTIQENIEYYLSNQHSFLYASIMPLAFQLEKKLQQLFSYCNVAITGSFKRQCEIIEELTFVISTNEEEIVEAIEHEKLLQFQENQSGVLHFLFNEKLPIEIHTCDEHTFYETVFFTTNTAEFNDAFQTHFEEVVFEGNESEETIFEQANIEYIPSFLREDEASILLAKENSLPSIIQPKDVKGVIHNHSVWSDGKNTIEEMAMACMQRGYEYFVISDHSQTSTYAKGLSVERVLQQQEEIEKLNEKLAPFKIFKSIECDILNDGRLDYEEDVLKTFDLVITSVHQNLKMTEEKAMQRLLKAIENPYTRILGHPTGRLLLSRKGYPINYSNIIDACKASNVVIELNANPRRLDLDWRFIQEATQKGVLISINPDAHNIKGIDDIYFGVLAAQKGMLTKENNLSSKSLLEFEQWLKTK